MFLILNDRTTLFAIDGLVPETQVRLISRAENKVLLNMETDRKNPLNVNHDSIYLVYVDSYFFNRD